MKSILKVMIVSCYLIISLPSLAQNPNYEYNLLHGGQFHDLIHDVVSDDNHIYVVYWGSDLTQLTDPQPDIYGQGGQLLYAKIDKATGNLLYSRNFPGMYIEGDEIMHVENGFVYFMGHNNYRGFPATDSSYYSTTPNGYGGVMGFLDQLAYVKIDANSDSLVYAKTYGGGSDWWNTGGNYMYNFGFGDEKGVAFIYNADPAFPMTITPLPNDDLANVFVGIDLPTGNILYSRSLSMGSEHMAVKNNTTYLVGWDIYNPSVPLEIVGGNGILKGSGDIAIAKLDINGSVIYSTYMGSTANDIAYVMDVDDNGDLFIAGHTDDPGSFSVTAGTPIANGDAACYIKINNDNTLAYTGIIDGSGDERSYFIKFDDHNLYLTGTTYSKDLPVTDLTSGGPATSSANQTYLARIDKSSGALNALSYPFDISTVNYPNSMDLDNGILSLAADGWEGSTLTTTDGTVQVGNTTDAFVRTFAPNGDIITSTIVSGTFTDNTKYIENDKACFWLVGNSNSLDFPMTAGTPPHWRDVYALKYNVDVGFDTINTIAPLLQAACQNGYVQTLQGNVIKNAAGNLSARYQWQEAATTSGPWSDITNETNRFFTPTADAITKYYRRVAYQDYSCKENDSLSTSNISEVTGNSLLAATVDAGGLFYACSGASIVLGGSPVATGGLPPYTYAWDMAASLLDSTVANPTAAVTENTIFTLFVTDSNGCVSVDQAVLNIPTPNAGADVSVCIGTPTQIGATPYPVSSGVTYSWAPATGLSCTTCAQPVANPTTATTYILTMTVPNGAGVCILYDTVNVNVITGPAANFAGTDKTLCYQESVQLGIGNDTTYNYTWAPGKYLNDYHVSNPTFDAGNDHPSPNQITYYVTAQKSGCAFYDELIVTEMEGMNVDGINAGMAGNDGCGPRVIGIPDRTPNIAETYQWTKLSGDGNILGPTNTILSAVSASVNTTSVYELVATFNGHICRDTLIVPACGCQVGVSSEDGNCVTDIGTKLIAEAGTLVGSSGVFTWSPQVGLNQYTGSEVITTDNLPHTYTVTFTSNIDTSFSCSTTFDVNQLNYSKPNFTALDTMVCPQTSVNIGENTIAGWTYQWYDPYNELSNSSSSNPSVTMYNTWQYSVTVTDTATGCFTLDTANLAVDPINANAGSNKTVCNNATVTLGNADPSNGAWTYQWSPSSSPWQNGTSDTSAQPDVLVATSLTFNLTVTDSVTGCSATDAVNVNVTTNTPNVYAGSDKNICVGDSNGVLLGAYNSNGVIYTWTPATGLSCTLCARPTATPTSTTMYTVTAKYEGNCTAVRTDSVLVTVNPNPIFNLGNDTTFCPAAPISIGNNAPSGMTKYSWSPSIGLNNSFIQNPTSSFLSEITYQLQVTDNNGCLASDDIKITPQNQPNAGIDRNGCVDEPTILGDANNDVSATWSPTTNLSCFSCPQPIFTPTTAGTFTYVMTQTVNGCTATDTVIIKVNEINPVIPAQPIVCQNSCVQMNVTPESGYSYSWTPVAGLSNPNIANPIACLGTSNASYVLSVKDVITGCVSLEPIIIGVSPDPSPALIVPNVTTCYGVNVPLDLTVTGPNTYSYLWSPAAGLDSINIEDPIAFGNLIGVRTYSVQVTDNATGCIANANVDVDVKANCDSCSVDAGLDKATTCLAPSVQIGTPGNIEDTYLWSPSIGLSNVNIAEPIASPTITTAYVLTVNGECSDTVIVTVDNTLPTADAGSDLNLNCTTTSGTIGSASVSGNTYSWSPATDLSASNISNPTASPTVNTSYVLTVTGANGCVAMDTVEVIVDTTSPILNITGDTTVCNNSNTVLTASGGFNYSWSSGSTTDTAIVGAGMYTVVVSGSNGCIDSATISVTIPQGASIGNYVWSDVNGNGLQDETQAHGINGLTIELWKEFPEGSNTYVLDQTTLTVNDDSTNPGYYEFVVCDSASYKVKFPLNTASQGLTSPTLTPNVDSNSDASTVDGFSPIFIVNPNGAESGNDNHTIDAGYLGAPLPVSLTSFTVTELNCNGVLRWTTASEENTARFDILRSKNIDNQYVKIGEKLAVGNSDVEQNYEYTDINVKGSYEYKLRIVDLDSKSTYSNTVGLRVDCSNVGFIKLYPNPVEEKLTIQSNFEQDDFYVIRLFDAVGKVIYESRKEVKSGIDKLEIPMSNLASGSYLIQINTENIGKQEYKIIKK